MLGKRKREASVFGTQTSDVDLLLPQRQQIESPTPPHSSRRPLTEANLAALNCKMPSSRSPKRFDHISSYCSSTHSGSSSHDNTTTSNDSSDRRSPTKKCRRSAPQLLDLHKIYLNRRLSKPEDLQALCNRICESRKSEATPVSKTIARKIQQLPNLSEAKAKQVLGEYLGYKGGANDLFDKSNIHIDRAPELNWVYSCVPNGLEQDPEFKPYLKVVKEPSTPRPDFTYGFSNSAFDETQKRRLAMLPDQYCTTGNQEPWFPYWIVEWKSSAAGSPIEEAETQARGAGAAAVNALHNFISTFKDTATSYLASDSAIFSMCVDSHMVEFFVHWKRLDASGSPSFEADCLGRFFLSKAEDIYQARSIIYNIRDWAVNDRLKRVKTLLSRTK